MLQTSSVPGDITVFSLFISNLVLGSLQLALMAGAGVLSGLSTLCFLIACDGNAAVLMGIAKVVD